MISLLVGPLLTESLRKAGAKQCRSCPPDRLSAPSARYGVCECLSAASSVLHTDAVQTCPAALCRHADCQISDLNCVFTSQTTDRFNNRMCSRNAMLMLFPRLSCRRRGCHSLPIPLPSARPAPKLTLLPNSAPLPGLTTTNTTTPTPLAALRTWCLDEAQAHHVVLHVSRMVFISHSDSLRARC